MGSISQKFSRLFFVILRCSFECEYNNRFQTVEGKQLHRRSFNPLLSPAGMPTEFAVFKS